MAFERSASPRIKVPRIGVVLDAFDASYQLELVKSLRLACQSRRLELVVFPGGILGSPSLSAPQRNSLYRLIAPRGAVQGLVLLGSTIIRQRAEVQAWCERLKPLPLCSIGLELEGVPSIMPDNQNGIRSLVRHLITDHGYRRLAFVGGPVGNQESCERHEAFRAELTARGLDGAAAAHVTGDFLPASGRDAVRILLDERRIELDAIVAANDYMALGIQEVIATRTSPRERRIAVTGFDNVAEAAFSVPPLTTVEQPLRALADAAVSCILAQLEGQALAPQKTAPQKRIDTRLWIRRSCGCKEPTMAKSAKARAAKARPEAFEMYMSSRFPQIGAEMERASEGLFVGMPGWDQQLLTTFVDQTRGVPNDPFLNAMDRMLQGLLAKKAEVWRFHGVLSVLRTHAIEAAIGDPRRSLEAEDLLHAARLMTGALAMRAQAREHAEIEEQQRVLNQLGARLSACNDLPSLFSALDETLPSFGLRKAFLMTYVGEAHHGWMLARLVYALRPGQLGTAGTGTGTGMGDAPSTKDGRGSIFDAQDLLPEAVWDSAGRLSWVILPLFSRARVLGFAMVELTDHHGADYEALRIHLSTALANALFSADLPPPSSANAADPPFDSAPPTQRN